MAMQFGMHQEVSDCVATFSRTKLIAWKNFCIPISNIDVTTHYAVWWKQSILFHHHDFAKNITRQSSFRLLFRQVIFFAKS